MIGKKYKMSWGVGIRKSRWANHTARDLITIFLHHFPNPVTTWRAFCNEFKKNFHQKLGLPECHVDFTSFTEETVLLQDRDSITIFVPESMQFTRFFHVIFLPNDQK